MAQKVKAHGRVVYEDFSLGDYGIEHPRFAKTGSFHAKNLIVYRDGTLGPRNGLIEQPLSGANYVKAPLNAFFFGVENEVATPRMVYAQSRTPSYFEVNTMTPQNPGRFTGPGGTPDPFLFDAAPSNGQYGVLPRLGFNTFFSSLGDKAYLLDNLSDEIEDLTGSEGAHDVVEYLDQVYLIGIGSAADGTGHKVTYSDNADPETWPIENVFAVGYAWVLFRGMQMLNGLIIIAQDESWWLLQGTPEEGSLRRVWHGDGPALGNPRSAFIDQETAWFLQSGAPGGSHPASFDGSKVTDLDHLRGWMSDANAAAVLCEADHDILFVDNDARALMRHNGVWTRHEYEVEVGEWAAAYEDQRFYLVVDGVQDESEPVFYRSSFEDGSTPPIYEASGFHSPGDGSLTPIDAWVEFPELWQAEGEQVRPHFVIVEFTSYDTGANLDPHLEVEVDIIDRFGQESTQTVSAGTWDESDATVSSTTDGVRRRHIFRGIPATAPGSALQLRIKDIRGLKIEKAILDFEVAEQLDNA